MFTVKNPDGTTGPMPVRKFLNSISICLMAFLLMAADVFFGDAPIPWNGLTSFVEGTVELTDLKTSGEGELLDISAFDVSKNQIVGLWVHHDAIGGIEIKMTKDGPKAELFCGYCYGTASRLRQVGRDLYVEMYVNHDLGGTDVAFTLKGVFASDAQIVPTAQPKPSPQKSPSQQMSLPTVSTPPVLKSSSAAERFKQLDDLFKQKLISKDEYERKRKEILDSL